MLTEIIYQDKEVLVVRKPAGLATQTARVGQQDVVSELKNYLRHSVGSFSGNSKFVDNGKAEPYLGVIHRLDQPVEGLLVFAKNRDAACCLVEQLQGQESVFSKRYYAVLCGIPTRKTGRLTDILSKESVMVGTRKEYRSAVKEPVHPGEDSAPGLRAELEYEILQVREAEGLALADIRLITGRFHQIRAQMAHGGAPLLGDMKYGSEASMALTRKLGIRYVALCAYSLEFRHPVSGKRMEFRIEAGNPAFSFFSQL